MESKIQFRGLFGDSGVSLPTLAGSVQRKTNQINAALRAEDDLSALTDLQAQREVLRLRKIALTLPKSKVYSLQRGCVYTIRGFEQYGRGPAAFVRFAAIAAGAHGVKHLLFRSINGAHTISYTDRILGRQDLRPVLISQNTELKPCAQCGQMPLFQRFSLDRIIRLVSVACPICESRALVSVEARYAIRGWNHLFAVQPEPEIWHLGKIGQSFNSRSCATIISKHKNTTKEG